MGVVRTGGHGNPEDAFEGWIAAGMGVLSEIGCDDDEGVAAGNAMHTRSARLAVRVLVPLSSVP